MNGRQAVLDVLERRTPARPVVCIRLGNWHRDAMERDALPASIRGMTVAEIAVHLGFSSAARYRDFFRVEFGAAESAREVHDDVITTTLSVQGHRLVTIEWLTPDMARAGMRAHIVKYSCESDDDYRALIAAWESARITLTEDGFRAFDRQVGDAGLPMAILGACPAHMVALSYLGYERFYIDQADRPRLQEKLISVIESAYSGQLWPQVRSSRAQLLLHGVHFSASMTPPPVFEKYFVPLFR